MYEVVICTVSTGRIQRKRFTDSSAAWACADLWNEKNRSARTYRVSVEIVANAPTKHLAKQPVVGRTASM